MNPRDWVMVGLLVLGLVGGFGLAQLFRKPCDPCPVVDAPSVDVDSLKREAFAWQLMAQATHERNELLRRELDSLTLARVPVKQLIDNATRYLHGAPVDSLGRVLDGAE